MIEILDLLIEHWRRTPKLGDIPIYDAIPDGPDPNIPYAQVFQRFEGGEVQFTTGVAFRETYEYVFEVYLKTKEAVTPVRKAIEGAFDLQYNNPLIEGPIIHVFRTKPLYTQKMTTSHYRLIAMYSVVVNRTTER